ncbi:winged helix-turn-helix domain-containing protein [Colwellia piezophila]|uniref:winged helix-turn-helix domain-containing protein n=1 Tax=Colwellia piezophila TaxID=211668 RepID=UPI00035ED287|nr:winged helix-turn-helix domain-containing protein [Colwellia piezophila]
MPKIKTVHNIKQGHPLRYLHFADICIDTHNQLLYRQGETINLAPKVYDLLVYFCQHTHRVISKDELMEQVWTGTLVTENAISRTIVKVRKALADDPKNPQFIITVPRKGYRMVAEFVAVETVSNQKTSDCESQESQSQWVKKSRPTDVQLNGITPSNQTKSNLSKNTFWVIAGLMIIIVLTFVFSTKSNKVLQTKQVKALTREVGIELYPALSPDLTQLAYSKEVTGKPSYINIENLSNHVKRSISHSRAALSKPVWSPSEDKLAFLYQHNSVCMIYWAQLDNIKDKESWQAITECSADSSPHFVFSPDGQFLYFNDRQSASHGYQIFRVNLTNSEKDIVNQPITNGLGNYSFDISADGKSLVMVNSEFSPTTRIYTLNIEESKLKQTAKLDYLMRAVLWHHDNETIIHPSPHPAYELWQSNLDGTKLAVVASNTSRVKHLSRLNNGKDFSFVSYLLNRDIHFESRGQENIELDNSTVMDYLPALAHNSGQYAFVSKRSTSAEVYLSDLLDASTIENTKQFTSFNNPVKLYDLAFSPNDSQLMILADNQIYIANTNSMEVHKLPLDNIAIVGVSWQDENNLLLSSVRNADWYLMRYNINEQKLSPLPVGYQGGVYSAVDNSYYLIADDSFQVMKFSDLSVLPQVIPLTCQPSIINRKLNLKVTSDGLVCQSNAEDNQYKRYSFTTKSSRLWQKSVPSIDFDIKKRGMVYTITKQSVSDIMQTISL